MHHKTESVLQQRKPSHAREEKEGETLSLRWWQTCIAYSEEWIFFKTPLELVLTLQRSMSIAIAWMMMWRLLMFGTWGSFKEALDKYRCREWFTWLCYNWKTPGGWSCVWHTIYWQGGFIVKILQFTPEQPGHIYRGLPDLYTHNPFSHPSTSRRRQTLSKKTPHQRTFSRPWHAHKNTVNSCLVKGPFLPNSSLTGSKVNPLFCSWYRKTKEILYMYCTHKNSIPKIFHAKQFGAHGHIGWRRDFRVDKGTELHNALPSSELKWI